MSVESLPEAEALIARVPEREPLLNQRERQLVARVGSMGGTHPQGAEGDGEEWIAKVPRGSNVDQLLVEHACMELGRCAGCPFHKPDEQTDTARKWISDIVTDGFGSLSFIAEFVAA